MVRRTEYVPELAIDRRNIRYSLTVLRPGFETPG
jgi:hypothetical protein